MGNEVKPDALQTIRETCVILSIGPTKCWELIGFGHLEVVHLGERCTRVKKSSIDRLIECGIPTKSAKRHGKVAAPGP